jgi:phosphoglycolate phosphatase-like HAD superfamily hydrolase
MKTKKMYRAVVFDFDGVILDSGRIKTEAFPVVFDHLPEHHNAIVDYHINNQGISRYQKFEWIYKNLFDQTLTEDKKQELGQRFSDIVLQHVIEAKFIPGALALLAYLLDHNIPAFVASGTPEDELKLIVEQRELNKYFVGVFGSPSKKPVIVNRIERNWKIPSGEMLFIGDATTDYYAAQETGTDFFAVDSEELNAFWKKEKVKLTSDLHEIIHHMNDHVRV